MFGIILFTMDLPTRCPLICVNLYIFYFYNCVSIFGGGISSINDLQCVDFYLLYLYKKLNHHLIMLLTYLFIILVSMNKCAYYVSMYILFTTHVK